MLVEAASALQRIDPAAINDGRANEQARRAPAELEARLVARAHALPAAASLTAALRDMRHSTAVVIGGAVVLALLAGAGAARAALGSVRDEPVNIFWALGATLGLQTIMLLVWLALFVLAGRGQPNALAIVSLGGLLSRLAQRLAGKVHSGPMHAAAIAATAGTHLRGPLGTWTLSSISHGLWLAFNIGCIAGVIVLLSTRHYAFAWETTILSEQHYFPLMRSIGAAPKLAGFVVPTQEQVAASQWRGPREGGEAFAQSSETRQAWAGLLVGSMVVYGLGPRLLLLGLCLGQRRVAAARFRLDATKPEYLYLASQLMPQAKSIGIVDRDAGDSAMPTTRAARPRGRARPTGPPAILGYEIMRAAGSTAWPPPVHAVRWNDLGFVDTREDQRRVLSQLAHGASEPQTIVIACALTTTPDRGVATFLGELRATTRNPLTLVLSGGQALRVRTDAAGVNARIDDWHAMARRCGLDPQRIIELDLDHFTQASAAKLAAVVGSTTADASASPKLERAFDMIMRHAGMWLDQRRAPEPEQVMRLHRDIAALHRDENQRRGFLAMTSSLDLSSPAAVRSAIESGAARFIDVLPGRLRGSPRWLAAGAAAGALSCLAAASLATPAAIAALPLWSAAGAAVAAAVKLHWGAAVADRESPAVLEATEVGQAVRAAALVAIVFELQGRDERAITALIDRVVPVDDHLDASTPEKISRWLDDLRQRLDAAVRELGAAP